jgi:hypothetical protein
VQEFARALDKPEIWADIAPLLKSRVRRKPTMRKAKSRKKK